MQFRGALWWLIVSGFLLSAIGSASAQSTGESQTGQIGLPDSGEPNAVGAGGEFVYRIPLDIPDFRDLPLPVSLSYNSSVTARDGVDKIVAFGWSLNGFSMIERRSIGGGVPTFDDGQDIYVLDGQELMACSGPGATNPWQLKYPLRYLTDRANASCSAGGNLTSRVEDFDRISYDAASNSFTVTEPDGVKLTYTSVGSLVGDTSAVGTPEGNYATKARWLLTRIEDTQATPNVVTYTYAFAPSSDGYAHRPVEVSYGGYRIIFAYRAFPTASIAKFATGTHLLGRQAYQLRSVRIYDGTAPIRAYQLFHGSSVTTGTQLLQKVVEYGSNFVADQWNITGGTALPAEEFTYSPDTVSFESRTYPGVEFHEAVSIADTNLDGADELLFFARTLYRATEMLGDNRYIYRAYSLTASAVKIDASRSIVVLPPVNDGCKAIRTPTPNTLPTQAPGRPRVRSGTLVLPSDRSNATLHCLSHRHIITVSGEHNNIITETKSSVALPLDGQPTAPVSTILWPGGPHRDTFLLGNFDLDPSPEAINHSTFFDSTLGLFTAVGTVPPIAPYAQNGDALIGDFTGDGVDDIVESIFPFLVPINTIASRYFIRTLPETGFSTGSLLQWPSISGKLDVSTIFNASMSEAALIGVGDMNQDGLSDIVYHVHNGSGLDSIGVIEATGAGFRPIYHLPLNINAKSGAYFGNQLVARLTDARSVVADFNADGLTDILLHSGFGRDWHDQIPAKRYTSYRSWLFMNNGNGFTQFPLQGSFEGEVGLVAVGDFDGDGLADLALEGFGGLELGGGYDAIPGRIIFGNGGIPNRLVSVKSKAGGLTTIAYAPSSEFGTNQMPGIQQVVKFMTTDDGRGNVSTTEYRYVGGRYDFINRQPLGYTTVTAYLPAIAGESEGPQVVTTYLNDHIAEYGLVKSRIVTQGGLTLSREIFDYSVIKSGKGPWRADRISERKATRFGTELVETTSSRSFNTYGQVVTEVSLGFTNNGINIDTSDDVNVLFAYLPNLAAYIVDRPIYRREEKGAVHLYQTSNLIYAVTYSYDGALNYNVSPTVGNLTTVRELTLGLPTVTWRITRQMTYDDWGNVLTEKDAKGQTVATHTYDTTKRLFRVTTTNSLGHLLTTVWNQACQRPANVTDPNGRATSYVYDVFCREQQVNFPGGQRKITRYVGFGSPTGQYVEVDQLSGSAVAGSTFGLSRTYFDGLGQTYLTTSPGATSAIADSTIQISSFDARGNLAWKSIPLTWASFGATPSAAQSTRYTYDGLDRPLLTLLPDGTQRSTTYGVLAFSHFGGPSLAYPTVISLDEHCFDATSANTICGEARSVFDASGSLIRSDRADHALQDVDAGGSIWRVTQYRYDLKGRLIAVVDPGGATWAYTYDGLGNRLTSDDPGLGFWTLTYDLNNNLLSQTDAKGQLITFTYDALNRVLTKTVGTGTERVETVFTYDQVRATFFNIGQETTQKVWLPATGAVTAEVQKNWHITGALQGETHTIDGRVYPLRYSLNALGQVVDQLLPTTPDTTTLGWTGAFAYDAAGRTTAMAGLISSITYNTWGQPTVATYASTVTDTMVYNPTRGWLTSVVGSVPSTGSTLFAAVYTRTATGRISRYDTWGHTAGAYDFTYDYTGRLLTAINFRGVPAADQVFTYDKAGRLRSKGLPDSPAIYSYADPAKPDHAPSAITVGGATTTFTYDANGNMLTGLAGKIMTYDAENRPLSVTWNGKRTCYVYGVDGKRLKKVENLSPTQSCTALPASAPATVYFGPVEIRNWKLAGLEQILTYPHPSVKLAYTKTATVVTKEISWLHRDHLGSVRAITRLNPVTLAVELVERATYKPFGEQSEWLSPTQTAPETKGWIGERFDADAGLQYLNARYYDPVLGMFLQPDWFEVTKAGVGTNRFSYSFNDPVNKFDPGGNESAKKKTAETALKALKEAKDQAKKQAFETAKTQAAQRFASRANTVHKSKVPFDANGFPDFSNYLYQGGKSEVTIKYSGKRDMDEILANKAAGYKDTPEGYTWHHHQDYGKMQLVEKGAHKAVGHTGGFRFSEAAVQAGGSFDAAIHAAEKVLNSHTMRALELFDPTTYLDRMHESQTGYSIWDSEEERWDKWCGSNPDRCT